MRWDVYTRGTCFALVALALIGCGDKSVDVDAVNGAVAAKHTAKLRFEQSDVTAGEKRPITFTLAAPKQWKVRDGLFEPADKVINGESSMWVHSNCDSSSVIRI